MASYTRATRDTTSLVQAVARLYHPDLARARSRIAVVMVKVIGGHVPPIEAKPVGPANRMAGAADLVLFISQAEWDSRDSDRRSALIDHALCGIEAVFHGGKSSSDVAGRPRLRRRRREVPVGYLASWGRWREASVEAELLAASLARRPGNKPPRKPRKAG